MSHLADPFDLELVAAERAKRGGAMNKQDESQCAWTEDDDGIWETSCGESFVLTEGGGPGENSMRFCCYCGKALHEVPYRQEVD